MKNIDFYIVSLENYRDNKILGSELLDVWSNSPPDMRYIYYNLFHLVNDEDIRNKDKCYKNFQLKQLDGLISGLKLGKSACQLKHLNFINIVD